MNKHFKTWILAGFIIFAGCKSPVMNKERLLSHHKPVVERVGEVRTGGELNDPKVFAIDQSRILSLRQALLQSGNIRRPNQQAEQIAIVQPQASEQPVTKVEVSDSEILKAITPILSNEEAVNRLLGTNRSGRASGFNGSRAYSAPTETNLVDYMKTAVKGIVTTATNDPSSTTDLSKIDQSSTNRVVQLQTLRTVFEGSKRNDPEFASAGVMAFDKLIQALESKATVLPKQVAAASSTPVQMLQGVVQNNTKQISPMLIGIENTCDSYLSRNTTYFHPDLIYKTAVGDIPLRDGDFVFAIRAEDTSLPSNLQIQHEWSVPVLGVNDEFTAIDPNSVRQIQQVFQLKRDTLQKTGDIATIEDVCVLTRHYSGSLGTQSYYLPVSDAVEGTTEIPTGTVAPGDSFQFAHASRSPFVLARLLGPIQDRLKERQLEVKKKADCKSKLPIDGRYLSKWNANMQFYASPVVNSARSLVK